MSNSEAMHVDEAALFSALRGDLPDAAEMEVRVRARLAERAPRGVVLRFADWMGVRERAASIAGPVLMSMGLIRKEAVGVAAAKAALPKTVLSAVALPFAVLLVIGLTLNVAQRRTTKLRGGQAKDEEAWMAVADWWSERRGATAIISVFLAAFYMASPATSEMLLYLMALVAHALSAEHLSNGGKASRRTIAMSGINIGWMVYCAQMVIEIPSQAAAWLMDWPIERPPFEQSLLFVLASALTFGVVTIASVQGRSRFLRPWKLLTEGTDLDLAKLASLVMALCAAPAFLLVAYHYFVQSEGSLGERVWASRAVLAWIAFCVHTVVLVKRADPRR